MDALNPTNISTSAKIITAIDAVFTLAVEHVGMTFQLPVYHPIIVGSVLGSTYVLIKHKERITDFTLKQKDNLSGITKKTMKGAKRRAKKFSEAILVKYSSPLEN